MYTPEWIQEMANRIAGEVVNATDRGPCIQAFRNKNHLTQDELSHIMRLRRESISRIEHGRVTPTLAFVHRFSGVMALMEAVKAYRSQNKSIEYPYFSRIGLELGVPADSIATIIDLALQSYEQKRKKAIRSLEI
jgi:DNA-binding XRE family transcriptional regulator